MKRLFVIWLATVMLLTMVLPTSLATSESDSVQAAEPIELEVSRSTFSLTEIRTVEVKADFGEAVDLEELEFQFGGKSLTEWKKWSGNSNYDGDPFITVTEGPSFVDNSTEVTATLEFGLLYNTTNLSNRTIRTQYQQFIDDYELALIDSESGSKAVVTVSLNVYDEFLFNDEIKPAIDDVFTKAAADGENDRYLEYQNLGQSVEGRDMHFVILARDKESVDKYLEETLPTALEDPESLLEKLENGTMGDYQVPIWFNNIHPDEVEGVDAQVELFKKFALEQDVTFTNTDENKVDSLVTLNVDDVLDDAIFLYMFTNNPDGREANTRANAEGFDLNRDNAYQTQVETQIVTEVIAKWTPLSFLDGHGYVGGFLIEPTTPPHNPNFEYDLLIESMLEQAHAMGQAGVGNSDLDSYFIPRLTWEDGWDDMTPAYTAMLGMLHGALSHTIEVPTLSQNSLNAMVGTGLGATKFVTENKDELYKGQLEIFKRGVNGEDNRAADEYFVNAAGESIGRVREDNENFFPDYYVIPTNEDDQKNILEAHKMAEYLLRNGVNVEESTRPVKINGTTYPSGTYVVPMNQAKRGLANAMLYEGDDVSDWRAMYDPIVVNFPDLRGFNIIDVRDADLFAGQTAELDEVTVPTGSVTGNTTKQVLENSTNDTIKVVNSLLADGKTVEVYTQTKGRATKGDYIVNSKDLNSYEDTYYFESEPLGNGQNAKTATLSQPKVATTGSSQLNFSLRQLGFDLVGQSDADVIVSDGGSFSNENVTGKSYIGIGVYALNALRNNGVLPGFSWDYTGVRHEGLVKANVNDHQLTAGYEPEEHLYVTTGSWITSVPEGAEVLASFRDTGDFYTAGWWPGNQGAQGQMMAFTAANDDTTFTMFANDLAFRAHTEHSYRLLANSIFSSVMAETDAKNNGKVKDMEKQNQSTKSEDVVVENSKVKVNRIKDENGRNKVTSTVEKNALVKAEKLNQRLNKVTINSDRFEGEDLLEVNIPSSAVNKLKNTQPEALIELTFGESSYVLPLADIQIEDLAELKGNFTVSIEVSVEEEKLGGRDLEKHVLNVAHVKVVGKSGNKTEEITSFKSIEE